MEITYTLPDKWDGASGMYQGKDLSILPYLLELHGVTNKLETIRLISIIIKEISEITNERLSKQVKKNGK